MKFWQSITWAETDQLVALARFAEELGFEGIIGADHALYPREMEPRYPYSESGFPPQTAQSEYPDMWTSCAAMAAVTERLRFVCGVYVLPLRHPIEVAKQAAPLDPLPRPLALGVGTGWMKEEFDLYDVDCDPGRRMEMIEVLRGLNPASIAHHGEFFDWDPIVVSPKPTHPIPFYSASGAGRAPADRTRGGRLDRRGQYPQDAPRVLDTLASSDEAGGATSRSRSSASLATSASTTTAGWKSTA